MASRTPKDSSFQAQFIDISFLQCEKQTLSFSFLQFSFSIMPAFANLAVDCGLWTVDLSIFFMSFLTAHLFYYVSPFQGFVFGPIIPGVQSLVRRTGTRLLHHPGLLLCVALSGLIHNSQLRQGGASSQFIPQGATRNSQLRQGGASSQFIPQGGTHN
jgi:hypothetical protein